MTDLLTAADHALYLSHGSYRASPFWPNEQRIVDPEFGTWYEITTPTHSHTTTWNATDALIYYTDDCSDDPRYVYPGEQKQVTQHLSVEFVPN